MVRTKTTHEITGIIGWMIGIIIFILGLTGIVWATKLLIRTILL